MVILCFEKKPCCTFFVLFAFKKQQQKQAQPGQVLDELPVELEIESPTSVPGKEWHQTVSQECRNDLTDKM